jgi:hypothetical protein
VIHAAHFAPQRGITVVVKIIPSIYRRDGKLADAELHFLGGPLAGLKLVGFSIWCNGDALPSVTLPTREYTSSDGHKRKFGLLRPITEPNAHHKVVELILEKYGAYVRNEESVHP